MMNKVLMVLFPLCVAGAWFSIVSRNVSAPAQYQEYLEKAKQAYEQGYYKETMSWLGQITEVRDEAMRYEMSQLKRDVLLGAGDVEAYGSQCAYMVEQYPETEANYVYLIRYYKQEGDLEQLYRVLPSFREKWPENQELQELEQELAKSYSYVETGYYDVAYATSALLDIQVSEYEELEGVRYIRRKLSSSSGEDVFDYGYQKMKVARDGSSCMVQDQDGNWSMVDVAGNLLARNQDVSFDSLGSLGSNGIATGIIHGEYHFVNSKMAVSDLVWEQAATFTEDWNAVKKDGKWALVNSETWRTVSEFPYTDIAINSMDSCVVDGRCVVADEKGYYIWNASEEEVITQNYFEEIRAFESTQPTVYRKGDKWGFLNRNGEIHLEAAYEDAKPYTNGYAAVKQDGLWGYIDRYGTIVVEPQFAYALPIMADGTAYVKNEFGLWDYIQLHKLYYMA